MLLLYQICFTFVNKHIKVILYYMNNTSSFGGNPCDNFVPFKPVNEPYLDSRTVKDIFIFLSLERCCWTPGTGTHIGGPDGQSTMSLIFWVRTAALLLRLQTGDHAKSEASWMRGNCNNMWTCECVDFFMISKGWHLNLHWECFALEKKLNNPFHPHTTVGLFFWVAYSLSCFISCHHSHFLCVSCA